MLISVSVSPVFFARVSACIAVYMASVRPLLVLSLGRLGVFMPIIKRIRLVWLSCRLRRTRWSNLSIPAAISVLVLKPFLIYVPPALISVISLISPISVSVTEADVLGEPIAHVLVVHVLLVAN